MKQYTKKKLNHIFKTPITLLLISIMILSTLTACGSRNNSSKETVTENANNTSEETGTYPMTFDNYGRTVTIL